MKRMVCSASIQALIIAFLGIASTKKKVEVSAATIKKVEVVNEEPIPTYDVLGGVPFQFDLCTAVVAGLSCGITPNAENVPAGKRLVIELVTATCELKKDSTSLHNTILSVAVTTEINGDSVLHYFGVTPVSPQLDSTYKYTVTQLTRLYADPETEVSVGVFANALGSRRCFVTFSGRLFSI